MHNSTQVLFDNSLKTLETQIVSKMASLGNKTDKIGEEALKVAKKYKEKHAYMVESTEAKEKIINEKMGALEKHVDKVELVNERRLEEIEKMSLQI